MVREWGAQRQDGHSKLMTWVLCSDSSWCWGPGERVCCLLVPTWDSRRFYHFLWCPSLPQGEWGVLCECMWTLLRYKESLFPLGRGWGLHLTSLHHSHQFCRNSHILLETRPLAAASIFQPQGVLGLGTIEVGVLLLQREDSRHVQYKPAGLQLCPSWPVALNPRNGRGCSRKDCIALCGLSSNWQKYMCDVSVQSRSVFLDERSSDWHLL